MKQIINTVILYANEEEVFSYANELSQQTVANNIALVIVVNKKGDSQIEVFNKRLETLAIDTYVYDPGDNFGYLNGAIFGYEQYCQETNSVPEWVVVSNTDIEYFKNKFFEVFLHTVYDDDVWCVAPSVYNPLNKSYDNPQYINRCTLKQIDRLIYIYERPLLAYLHEKAAKLKCKLGRREKLDSQLIYSAHGCFFILRNEMALVLKERKYKAFMYSEESHISEIILQHNKKIYYDQAIEVIHNENTVTGRLAVKKRAQYIADSLKVIRDEFYAEDLKGKSNRLK